MTAEVWRPVPGWIEYEISSHGRVRSLERTVHRRNGSPYRVQGRILIPQRHRPGALTSVQLSSPGRHETVYIHKLVEQVFDASNQRSAA